MGDWLTAGRLVGSGRRLVREYISKILQEETENSENTKSQQSSESTALQHRSESTTLQHLSESTTLQHGSENTTSAAQQ